jgi:simple sugar transport system permease protein
MEFFTDINALGDFLGTSLRLAIPIAFAALGGVMAERSGVYNIGLEGMMLLGAFGAAAGSLATGSAVGGLLFGIVCGAMGGLTLAVLSVSLSVNQIVCGIAVNILAAGLTSFFARLFFGIGSGAKNIAGFERLPIPVLSEIPVIGPALFNQDALAYLLYLAVPLLFWIIFRTSWGLAIRATGERPIAVESAGISVAKIRYACVLASGALAGIGGCYLVLAEVFTFIENMSAGKGFVGLAALILGRWNPVGALMAALLFGLCDSLQFRLQFANPDVPYQIFVALPYVALLLALLGFYGRIHPPAALGSPYRREST